MPPKRKPAAAAVVQPVPVTAQPKEEEAAPSNPFEGTKPPLSLPYLNYDYSLLLVSKLHKLQLFFSQKHLRAQFFFKKSTASNM